MTDHVSIDCAAITAARALESRAAASRSASRAGRTASSAATRRALKRAAALEGLTRFLICVLVAGIVVLLGAIAWDAP